MTRRHAGQLGLTAALLLASTSASAAQTAEVEEPAPPAAAAVSLVRSTDVVAPIAVQLAPGASTTVLPLSPVPMPTGQFGIPARAMGAYRAAADRMATDAAGCRLTWPLLAAIGWVESGHGSVHGASVGADGRVAPPVLGPRLDGSGAFALISDSDGGALDGDPLLDRAVGPMQFIPSSWQRHRADGDGDGRADPHDLDDAALAAGRYLCAGGRHLDHPSGVVAAVFSYNHSYDYVRVVLTAAARYSGQSPAQWGVDQLPTPAVERTASPSPVGVVSPSPSPTSEPTSEPTPTPAPEPSYGEPYVAPPYEEPSPEATPEVPEPTPDAEPTEPAPEPTEPPGA